MSRHSAFLLMVALALTACTSDIEPLTPAQRQAVAEYVSKVAPTPEYPLDANFGGEVELLGVDVDRERWHPGKTIRVTCHWHAVRDPGKGTALFTQVVDENGRTLNQDGNSTLRWLYGPDRWRAGQYVRDVQQLHLPEDWTGTSARVYVGLSREGTRLPLAGDPDADGRMLAATIPTTKAGLEVRRALGVPEINVVQAKAPPRLDGLLDDAVWSFAQVTPAFVETRQGGPAAFRAFAKLLWDRRYLYVGVEVEDALLLSSHTEHDAHLWEQDCVELMIDPDGDGKPYFEIQVSPRGVLFDTRYDARRVPKPFGHVGWQSRARAAVSPRGTLDDDIADAGYAVEIAIPWQAFSRRPPAIGDTWRANLYVMDATREGQRAAAWSPLGVGDFHVPRRFGILAFEGTPDDMVGPTEPKQISSERMPAAVDRREALDRGVREKMIRKQAINRRNPDEPPPRMPSGAEDLESGEASH